MLSVTLAFVSSVLWGASDFAGGVSARRSSALHATLWAFASATAVSALAMAIRGGSWTSAAVVAGVVAGCCGLGGFLALYAALASAPMGVVTVIVGASEAVVPIVIGVAWRHEALSVLAWAGVIAAIGGAAMIGSAEGERGKASLRALALATASGLFFGLSVVALDAAPEESGFLTPTLEVAVGLVLLLALTVVLARAGAVRRAATAIAIWRPGGTSAGAVGAALVGGLLLALANIILLLALWAGKLAVVGVVLCLYPVATAALARMFLHERLSAIQVGGIVVALAGCAVLAVA